MCFQGKGINFDTFYQNATIGFSERCDEKIVPLFRISTISRHYQVLTNNRNQQ